MELPLGHMQAQSLYIAPFVHVSSRTTLRVVAGVLRSGAGGWWQLVEAAGPTQLRWHVSVQKFLATGSVQDNGLACPGWWFFCGEAAAVAGAPQGEPGRPTPPRGLRLTGGGRERQCLGQLSSQWTPKWLHPLTAVGVSGSAW